MNIEDELKKTWTLYEMGAPMYHRGGQIEVDDPMAVSPEDTKAQLDALQIGQKPTGTAKENPLSGMGPLDGGAAAMGQGLMQGIKDIGGALVGGGVQSVGGAIDDVHLYGSQRLNPGAAGKAQVAPGDIVGLWREMTDGIRDNRDAQGQMDEALRLINEEGQAKGLLQPGQRYAIRRNEKGFLEPIVADDSMTDSALVAAGRPVASFYATDPLGGAGAAVAAGAKLASEVDPGAIGAGLAAASKADTSVIRSAISGRGAATMRTAAETEVQRIRAQYPVEEGWAPLELTGVTIKDGKPIPTWKQPAYNFHIPPEGVSKEQWQATLADRVTQGVKEVADRAAAGDEAAKFILSQASWYRDMRNRLRQEFGGMADLFADLLGTTSAQTNVRTNWDNAVEIMRRFSRGEYDKEIANYERAMAAGEDPNKVFAGVRRGFAAQGMSEEQALAAASEQYPMLTKASGRLFGTNSPTSTGALIDTFRQIKAGASPKTPNFTGNLIGYTNEATVDVWAARYLSDLAGQPRIPPPSEKAVGGKHLTNSSIEAPRVGGEFGFGQKVFKDAAASINAQGIIPGQQLGPDDLQAVAWFIEKEKWTQAGWTNKAGEGGSLDFEASRAGARDPARLNELRQVLNSSTASDAERLAAQAEYDDMAAAVDRTVLGISGERPNAPMSNYGQAELAAEIDDVLRGDTSVVAYKATNTYGRFMKQDERALDVEIITRKGFDPTALERRTIEMGKQYDQDAVFVSRVLTSPDQSPNARPGAEIYFSKKQTPEEIRKVTDILNERGIDGFTFVTDARQADRVNVQARAGGPDTAGLTGIRFQYIPEFDDSFDAARRTQIMRERADAFNDVTRELLLRGDVSSAQVVWYDTKVTFRDQYDAKLGTAAPAQAGRGEVGGRRPDDAPVAGAASARGSGPVGAGTVPDGQRGPPPRR